MTADPPPVPGQSNAGRPVRWWVAVMLAFAALAPATAAAAAAFEDTIAQRVLACTGCHGKEGRAGPDGYYPRIAGKPEGYLFNQLRNFRDERRHYELMNGLLALLDDDYLHQIAAYFSGLELPYPPPLAAIEPAALRERGEALVRNGDPARSLPACSDCHGAAMTGRAPFIPGLLGLPRDYLNAQLGAWRNGQRRAMAPDCMAEVARSLAPEEIGAVSAWLAAQPVPPHAAAAASEPNARLPLPCGGVAAALTVGIAGAEHGASEAGR
jgi:cytochrome c553